MQPEILGRFHALNTQAAAHRHIILIRIHNALDNAGAGIGKIKTKRDVKRDEHYLMCPQVEIVFPSRSKQPATNGHGIRKPPILVNMKSSGVFRIGLERRNVVIRES